MVSDLAVHLRLGEGEHIGLPIFILLPVLLSEDLASGFVFTVVYKSELASGDPVCPIAVMAAVKDCGEFEFFRTVF